MPRELPETRRCPSHGRFWPTEDAVRPIEEFRVDKRGHIAPTYCRRCASKRNTEYHQRLKEGGVVSPRAPSPMKALLDALRDDLNDLAQQIDTGDEAQLNDLAEMFGATAAEKVLPMLQHYAQQRGRLPEKVYDQRKPPKAD